MAVPTAKQVALTKADIAAVGINTVLIAAAVAAFETHPSATRSVKAVAIKLPAL